MDDTIRYFMKRSNNMWESVGMPHDIGGAFKKTLEKWAIIADGGHHISGLISCGLCNRYNTYVYDADRGSYCNACPIHEYTGKQSCAGTPYVSYYHAADSVEVAYAIFSEILFLLRMCRLYNTACRLPCKRTS